MDWITDNIFKFKSALVVLLKRIDINADGEKSVGKSQITVYMLMFGVVRCLNFVDPD